MKVKCLFLVALVLVLTSIGFAQSKTKADYIGGWFDEQADELNISPTKMVRIHAAVTQTDTFRDVTGAGKKKIYYLQIVKTSVKISLPKFLSFSINKNSGSILFGDKEKQVDELTITHYKTLADMKAGKNPQHDELWNRISKTNSDASVNTKIIPNVIVKNLYAAQKAGSGPFFQYKNRIFVDKYFTKDFADMIWKDAMKAKGEVGAIDFDPLYGSQDPQIKEFMIMETGWAATANSAATTKQSCKSL
jgi:hypothetical protein